MHRLKTPQQQHGCTWLQHARRPVADWLKIKNPNFERR
jgi:hypothetical protein